MPTKKTRSSRSRTTDGGGVQTAPEVQPDPNLVPYTPGLRTGSKQAMLADLMYRPWGASIDELTKALDWKPHTVRAAITGLRKRGYVVTSSKREDGTSSYRARPSAASRQWEADQGPQAEA